MPLLTSLGRDSYNHTKPDWSRQSRIGEREREIEKEKPGTARECFNLPTRWLPIQAYTISTMRRKFSAPQPTVADDRGPFPAYLKPKKKIAAQSQGKEIDDLRAYNKSPGGQRPLSTSRGFRSEIPRAQSQGKPQKPIEAEKSNWGVAGLAFEQEMQWSDAKDVEPDQHYELQHKSRWKKRKEPARRRRLSFTMP